LIRGEACEIDDFLIASWASCGTEWLGAAASHEYRPAGELHSRGTNKKRSHPLGPLFFHVAISPTPNN